MLVPVRDVTDSIGQENRVVSYINGVFTSQNDKYGYIEFNLDTAKVIDIMDVSKWQYGQDTCIFDQNGYIVSDNSGGRIRGITNDIVKVDELKRDTMITREVSYNGGASLLIMYRDSETGWLFTSVSTPISESAPMSINMFKNTSVILLGVMIVAFLVLVIIFWRRLYQPFKKLVGKVTDTETMVDMKNAMNFEYVDGVVNMIMESNRAMKNTYLESILVGGRELYFGGLRTAWRMGSQIFYDNNILAGESIARAFLGGLGKNVASPTDCGQPGGGRYGDGWVQTTATVGL